MSVTENVVTKADVRGTASGVLFMAFFGTVWANIGIGGIRISGAFSLLILAILIGTTLFFSGIRMIRNSRHLSNTNKSSNAKNIDKWFINVFVSEFGLFGVSAIVTNRSEERRVGKECRYGCVS